MNNAANSSNPPPPAMGTSCNAIHQQYQIPVIKPKDISRQMNLGAQESKKKHADRSKHKKKIAEN